MKNINHTSKAFLKSQLEMQKITNSEIVFSKSTTTKERSFGYEIKFIKGDNVKNDSVKLKLITEDSFTEEFFNCKNLKEITDSANNFYKKQLV